MSIKNNKNICLVYIYMEIWEDILHYYIVYYIFPDIKNIVLFSVIMYIYILYIIYTL